MQSRLDELAQLWQTLNDASTEKRQKLQDAQKRDTFIREADEVSAWISDREAVASSEELGRDLEHVEMLQKSFLDFKKDLEANKTRIEQLGQQARKLLRERHPDSDMIESRQEAVRQNWAELQMLAQRREEKLAGAHEIQKFNRSAWLVGIASREIGGKFPGDWGKLGDKTLVYWLMSASLIQHYSNGKGELVCLFPKLSSE